MTLARLTAKRISPQAIRAEVDTLVEGLKELDGLQEVILFGSAATGQMTEASDLDFVLVFLTPSQAKAALKRVYRDKPANHRPVDFLCIDRRLFEEKSAVGGVLFVARREGQTLFRREVKGSR